MIARYLLFIISFAVSTAGTCEDAHSLSPEERAYGQQVTAKIRPLISLPPQLKKAASVQLDLSIRSDGSIRDIEVKNATGPKEFSDAIRQGIVKAQPLPSPPVEQLKDGIRKLTITYSLPAKVTAEQRSFNDGFPNTYVTHDPTLGDDRTWRRVILWGSPSSAPGDPQLFSGNLLVRPNQGTAVIYTAPGPAMKPGSELSIADAEFISLSAINPELAKKFTGREDPSDKKMPVGQPNTSTAYFAVLLKKGDEFTLLPLNYEPANPKELIVNHAVRLLRSLYDAVSDRYLLFEDARFFNTPSWDSTIPSWEHFDAWWLDANKPSIKHVTLPPGPWVTDARLDAILLRAYRNFSCGTDCYRHYNLKIESGVVLVTIEGRPSAISESVTGTYKLKPDGSDWEKVSSSP